MQGKDEKSLQLTAQLGVVLKRLREEKTGLSLTQLAYRYGIEHSNLSRIENGKINCKLITLWKISEALGMKFSDLAKHLEDHLGEDFKLIDE